MMEKKQKPRVERFAKKSLGQNFLVDKTAIAKIVDSIPSHTKLLLEVGPGRGALSTEIFRTTEKLCLLEKDDIFAEKIGGTLFIHGARNFHVFHSDALEFEWERLWSETDSSPDTPLVVAANLPYNVATEIFFRLLNMQERIPFMALMFQKEVGLRLAGKPGTKEYGIVSVAAQNYYEVKVQQILKPASFRPSPKVDSAVLEFRRREKPRVDFSSKEDFAMFVDFVRMTFAHRRKTLENSLSMEMHRLPWLGNLSKAKLQEKLRALGVESNCRAETLDVEEFGRLYRALAKSE